MKVLVTGGAGYIGSHTCKLLAEIGHEPIVYDNLSTGHRMLARYGPLIEGDITDAEALRTALVRERPEAVIHFAASAYVGESVRAPRAYYRNNVVGTLTLLDAMQEAGIANLVFSSSCATYGIPDELPIREESPQQPINPYGQTKLVCEHMARATADAELLDCIALRYFNASGADAAGEIGEMHDPETHAIPLILGAIAGDGGGFKVLGDDYPTPDGSCIRDYLHVSDLARAHLLALEKLDGRPSFEAVNLGTGQGHSVKELVAAAQRVTGRSFEAEVAPRRPGDPPVLVADAAKARKLLGWTPTESDLDTILASAWNWMHSPHNPWRREAALA